MIYVFLNRLSNNGKGGDAQPELEKIFEGQQLKFIDITSITNAADSCRVLNADDKIIIAGGDGTLSRFVNDIYDLHLNNEILFYTCGSGNDFWNDLGKKPGEAPEQINKYIKDLPFVEVNGMKKRFLNGIGYGIDGYCCEVGDQMREAGNENIDYAGIAIKGLLFHYKPTNAEIDVDGQKFSYTKVWLAPSMNGRYYGGGMIATPGQDRLGKDRLLSLLIFHGSGKIRTLAIFPSIFKGKHVDHKKVVEVKTGHKITVTFDRPVALQIDGETVLNVTTYTAYKE